MTHVPRPADAAAVLASAYGGVVDAVAGLTEDDGWAPTRCTGWCVRDLLFHLYADARRGLAVLCTPTDQDAPLDRDWVTYWQDWQPREDGDQVGLRMVRISASTFDSLASLRDLHAETARAAAARASDVDPQSLVATQGHVLTAGDFMLTLAVEAAVHHLDLTVELALLGPAAEPVRVARNVVEGVLDATLPSGWDDATAVLLGTGRMGPTPSSRSSSVEWRRGCPRSAERPRRGSVGEAGSVGDAAQAAVDDVLLALRPPWLVPHLCSVVRTGVGHRVLGVLGGDPGGLGDEVVDVRGHRDVQGGHAASGVGGQGEPDLALGLLDFGVVVHGLGAGRDRLEQLLRLACGDGHRPRDALGVTAPVRERLQG